MSIGHIANLPLHMALRDGIRRPCCRVLDAVIARFVMVIACLAGTLPAVKAPMTQ